MAIETIILRPIGALFGGAAGTAYELFPSTTSAEDAHLLISEEVPDGDATYCVTMSQLQSVDFFFSPPDAYINKIPCSMRMVVCARSITAGSVLYASTTALVTSTTSSNGYEINYRVCIETIPTEEYDMYKANVNTDNMLEVWSRMLNPDDYSSSSGHVSCSAQIPASGNAKATHGKVAITQLYLEVDFESEDNTTEIYIKKDNVWLGSTQQFQKADGSWIEISVEECKNLIQTLSNKTI